MKRPWNWADIRVWILLISVAGMVSSTLFAYYLSALFNAPVDAGFVFRKSQIGTLTIVQFSVMAVCMLAAWYACFHIRNSTILATIAVAAVLCRLLLLGAEPYTSNDADRYLFDGRMVVLGLDPYVSNHELPELKDEVAAWRPPLEHRQYPTLYPPLALDETGRIADPSVNLIRALPARGLRVWGARTLSAETRWRSIAVRRLVMTRTSSMPACWNSSTTQSIAGRSTMGSSSFGTTRVVSPTA